MPGNAERPYFQKTTAELEQIVAADCDTATLILVDQELRHRSRPGARRLATLVAQMLDARKSNQFGHQRTPGNSEFLKTEQPNAASSAETGASHPPPQKDLETDDKTGDGDDEDNSEPEAMRRHSTTQPLGRREFVPTRLRPRGSYAGLPQTPVVRLEEDLTLDIPPTATCRGRYVAGLSALVRELRRKGAGQTSLLVREGQRVPMDADRIAYQFRFEGEADNVFEGASVVLRTGSRTTPGRLVGVVLAAGELVVEVEADLGPSIDVAELLIDNTAMLEQLAERLNSVGSPDTAPFNEPLADAVMLDRVDGLSFEPVFLTADHSLRADQVEAASTALRGPLVFIWGPPGTGKTHTLTAVVQSLFEDNKRVIICSNTNQAVDQVLLKICRHLQGTRMVEEGKIVRLGRIVHDELARDYSEYVTPSGIAARLGAELRRRKEEIERETDKFRNQLEPLEAILRAFAQLRDHAHEQARRSAHLQEKVKARDGLAARSRELQSAMAGSQRGIDEWNHAGLIRRILLTPAESLKRTLENQRQEMARTQSALQSSEDAVRAAREIVAEFEAQLAPLQNIIRGADEARTHDRVRTLQQQIAPLTAELA